MTKFLNFSRITWLIPTKPGTKHSLVKGIQVFLKEGLSYFPRGDDYEIGKIHWKNFKTIGTTKAEPCSFQRGDHNTKVKTHEQNKKKFFSRITRSIWANLEQRILKWRKLKLCFINSDHSILKKEIVGFFLLL